MPDSPPRIRKPSELLEYVVFCARRQRVDEAGLWHEWTCHRRESLREFAAVGDLGPGICGRLAISTSQPIGNVVNRQRLAEVVALNLVTLVYSEE